MKGEFCRFETSDGLELQGFWSAPGRKTATALVHVHGWDGNFYENRFIEHACRAALANGMAFFTFNNRGHDYIADLLRPAKSDYVQLGGVYEKMADSALDIDAAIAFCRRRGIRRVVLQGHSHGAVKAGHYVSRAGLGHDTNCRNNSFMSRAGGMSRIAGLVLLSPSDDLGLIRQQLGKRYPVALRLVRKLVAKGQGRTLMPGWANEYPVSAQTFLDCFGPDSITAMFNVSRTDRKEFPELASIKAPVLLAVGTEKEAFVGPARDYVKNIAFLLDSAESFAGYVIEGAPHNYLGHERELGKVLAKWLKRQTQAKSEVRSQSAECRRRGCGQ